MLYVCFELRHLCMIFAHVVYPVLVFHMAKFPTGEGLMELSSSFGSVSSYEHASPSKEITWLASIFSGVILCLLVYRSTAILSSLFFKGYGKLSTAQKIEWNSRGFSTFHALFVSFASFYLLIISDIFKDSSHEELVVNRSSTLTNTALGISIGYFLTDLAMILWYFQALGGLEYVLHHGLSMFSILVSLLTGQIQIYVLMVLLSEITTPFVNLRWYLDIYGLKSSKLYIVNGIALFLGWMMGKLSLLMYNSNGTMWWPLVLLSSSGCNGTMELLFLVARIFLFMFFFFHIWTHFDEVKEVFPLCFYCMFVVPPILAMMNIFWFWKIAKGMVKTLTKSKHKK